MTSWSNRITIQFLTSFWSINTEQPSRISGQANHKRRKSICQKDCTSRNSADIAQSGRRRNKERDRNNSIQGSHTRCGDENQDSWATAKHPEVARGKRGRVEKKVVLSPYINSGNKRWELAFIYADAPEARLVLGYFFLLE